ncbi:MAG: methyl-accepting chemotaxis protein [Deltaproteobacteria bacterium]|nr:methyl-accepting chemotaxis protein [Deltaproteobacteria bacterium]TLN03682.1 MAG: HAMP domain-containing protein [bacterium]
MGFADVAKIFGTLRLHTKMLLLMTVLLIGSLLITLAVFQTLTRVRIGSDSYQKVIHARDTLEGSVQLKSELMKLRAELLGLAANPGNGKLKAGITTTTANIQTGFSALATAVSTQGTKDTLAEARKSWDDLATDIRDEIIPAADQGEPLRLRELLSSARLSRYDQTTATLDSLIATLRSEAADRQVQETAYASKTVIMGFGVGGGLFLLLLLIGGSLAFSLVRAISREAEFAQAVVQEGNLSDRLTVESDDEIGELAEALNKLVEMLHDMVSKVDVSSLELSRISRTLADASKKVVNGAEQSNGRVAETSSAVAEINASIKEVSHGIDGLSLSASENSSSVLEMAASVEEVALNVENLSQSVDDVSSSIIEMAAAIKHISDSVNGLIDSSTVTASSVIQMDSSIRQVEKSALDTTAISEEVRRDAETGKVSVEATIKGMQEIKRSSHITHEVIVTLSEKASDIGTILSVINEVAEQTNLLALNAAIIAAQAGEQGKGFAVVADEIKELADRTSSSTREIEDLIQGVQVETKRAVEAINLAEKSIADGELLSQKSGVALGKIVSGVEMASEQVGEIARAAAEQAKGSQMIREAMEQVTDMIMQIANATQQQNKGSELIMTAVERMKVLTAQVRSSTREQSKVGSLIAGSTENITSMIQQIKRACDEQSRGSEQIVTAVEDIQKSTHENLSAAGTMEKAVNGLFQQVEVLKKEISTFSLKENR